MNVIDDQWYVIQDTGSLDTPALVVYVDRVNRNIQTAVAMIGDVRRLRPHIKTHKASAVVQLMLGAGINKFKCATIAEAEILGDCLAPDVLLAYQPVGPKINRLARLIERYPATIFSCLVDDLFAAQQIDQAFAGLGLTVPVFIDINLGQNRTGILPGSEALDLYFAVSKMKGIRQAGLHGYDGHIRNQDWNIRKAQCDAAFAFLDEMNKAIVLSGLAEPVIIVGGSPTYSIHCKREKVECSPGTFIYWDKGYLDLCPEQQFIPAALVISRVISTPSAHTICLDLGHKGISAENSLEKRVFFLNGPDVKAIGHSEEHLVLESGSPHHLQTGAIFYGIPYHICPTVALYERVHTVTDHLISGEWLNEARDRKITI